MTVLHKVLLALILALTPVWATAEDPPIPPPQGFVSDFAGAIDQPTRQQLTRLIQELKDKTGAEIAIVTVETTQPLTTFDYAMKVAEAWKPGEKNQDNGVVFLVATKDRKMFILTGYGVEGVLPDGKIGAIQDEYILPFFKQGDYGQGILAGTQVMASLIAHEYGVSLTGEQLPRRATRTGDGPSVVHIALFTFIVLALIISAFTGTRRSRYSRFGGRPYHPGGFGGRGFGGGGFGGAGGGFGGFGGGGFGGGGAGRSW